MFRLFRRTEPTPLRPPVTWSSRLFGVVRFCVLALAAAVFMPGGAESPVSAADPTTTAPATAPSAVGPGGIPGEVVEALKSLRSNKPDDRAKAYAILSEKADARILPAINSYFRGELHLRNAEGKVDKKGERLALYGATYDVEGGKKAVPVMDALTGEPIMGQDGKPVIQANRPDLGSAFTKPLNAIQQKPVLELRAFLSLLHPDEEIRKASIREAGERAARVFPDPEAEEQFRDAMRGYRDANRPGGTPLVDDVKFKEAEVRLAAALEAALTEKPKSMFVYVPTKDAATKVSRELSTLVTAVKAVKGANDKPVLWPAEGRPSNPRVLALGTLSDATARYVELVDVPEKGLEELPRTNEALRKQLAMDPKGPFASTYEEAIAQMDIVLGDDNARLAAIPKLGEFGTGRAANILRKLHVAAGRLGDAKLAAAVEPALARADSYQRKVRFAQYTFAGLSSASIYVLLALGLAIIFGLMGVINMAHGEFMMVGAFTTYVVASWFKTTYPGAYDYFPILAVPAAFVVAGFIGLLVEFLVIRHLYGRTTETLVATIGVGIILVQLARTFFGDNLSVSAPKWMQGSTEVAPDLLLNRARLWTIAYCVICVAVVYLIVNKTKLGLLLRATTQNRKMAAALGVPTRGVDALTFAFGAGLAGMAGVTIPMIDKIKPAMGGDYVIMSFMVVVVGGVGKIAGAIIAGIGLGSIGNYLEPALSSIQALAKTSTVVSKVLVLAAIVAFLQKRPSGLFPPKGRVADA